jgi:hypothetical protein
VTVPDPVVEEVRETFVVVDKQLGEFRDALVFTPEEYRRTTIGQRKAMQEARFQAWRKYLRDAEKAEK